MWLTKFQSWFWPLINFKCNQNNKIMQQARNMNCCSEYVCVCGYVGMEIKPEMAATQTRNFLLAVSQASLI